MSGGTGYLFLEGAVLAFFIGFCWEHLDRSLLSLRFWRPALWLAGLWFTIDQAAVRIGLWSFPVGGTLRFRIVGLPLEECLLFFIHSLMCFLLRSSPNSPVKA